MNLPCQVIDITTPKKFTLNGLYFGPPHPLKIVIFIHGLGGNAFSGHKLLSPLISNDTGIIFFSSRGHDNISKLKKIDKRKKKGYSSVLAGEALEIFTDCVDDLQGAVDYAKKLGAKKIYLAGHSTGCQKSVYFLSQRGKQKQIHGVILMAPMSDYSAIPKMPDTQGYNKSLLAAQRLIKSDKKFDLMSQDLWPEIISAQRFVSLYTPDSPEEIFCYAQPNKKPATLRKIKIPTLVILAQKDEFRDRPIFKIAKWFTKNIKGYPRSVEIINNAPHAFTGHEQQVAKLIGSFI